jgi:hypothetical protein
LRGGGLALNVDNNPLPLFSQLITLPACNVSCFFVSNVG